MLLFAGGLYAQQTGIFQSYIVLDINNSGNQFLAGGINADNAPTFSGQNFGTVTSLVLNGGELKTFKNGGGDVFGGEINYRVYPQGSPSGTFTAINLPFNANLTNPGDQRWQEALAGVNLLAGLTPSTTYELEVFWRSPTNLGDRFDSNFGNNFTATFTTSSAAPVPTMSEWGLVIFALLVLCIGAAVLHKRRESFATTA
ncbi:MAG: IPTL-CTERM sorting domain-containing protein [Bacteroidota bacterium]